MMGAESDIKIIKHWMVPEEEVPSTAVYTSYSELSSDVDTLIILRMIKISNHSY